MEWLTNNAIANIRGPAFLLFYAGVIGLTLLACWLARRALDWTGGMPSPAIPHDPDPHEIAYLRGGENEVTRSVIFALVQKGLLQVSQQGSDHFVEQVAEQKERRTLSPIERRTLDWFTQPQKTSGVFRSGALATQLKPFCSAYEQRLKTEKLLTTDEMQQRARMIIVAGTLFVLGLGAYKLLVALSRGRSNVGFLVALGIAGFVLLLLVCRTPRVSRRGREYMERLRLAFERLRYNAQPAPQPQAAGVQAFDPSLLLLVGVFGVGALAGTPYDYFQQSFRQAAANGGGTWAGSSCGHSCGSSDSSSSSGGSCSSGSSCGGGGGCGGGGCGGCGS
jgi:uncharacterized protein (TIGR04222 family)